MLSSLALDALVSGLAFCAQTSVRSLKSDIKKQKKTESTSLAPESRYSGGNPNYLYGCLTPFEAPSAPQPDNLFAYQPEGSRFISAPFYYLGRLVEELP